MARVAITEYSAKRLLIGDSYNGLSVTKDSLKSVLNKLDDNNRYVVKIDVGIKKRGLQNLITINISRNEVETELQKFFAQGYERCLIEPYIEHKQTEERYLSLSLERLGLKVIYSLVAGVEIEKNHDQILSWMIPRSEALDPSSYLHHNEPFDLKPILEVMHKYHFSFLEMNPYLVQNNNLIPIDLAVEIDTVGLKSLPEWASKHLISKSETSEEAIINKLNETSQASFNLHLLNPNGSILTLLSGGGASLIAIDTLVANSLQDKIINYCEYSGSPTREETHLFSATLLSLLFKSQAKKKVVLIVGGVSNFTDVFKTFQGIVDGIKENIKAVKSEDVCFIVRRGGLNQTEGLAYLTDFFAKNGIRHEVHGPDLSLGKIGSIVSNYL